MTTTTDYEIIEIPLNAELTPQQDALLSLHSIVHGLGRIDFMSQQAVASLLSQIIHAGFDEFVRDRLLQIVCYLETRN
jgi:hypothetical protein